MLKGINWKFVMKTTAWLCSLVGVVVLMSFISVKKQAAKCSNIKILIPGADNFIEREEVDAMLKLHHGQLVGRNLHDINLNDLEDKIRSNPYIEQAKIFADMNGEIHIEISQREPILRVITAGLQDYYIDSKGLKMPISTNFTANVLVANGHIREPFNGRLDTLSTKMGRDLYKTASFIKADTLWNAQIEQVFVNDRLDIELVPRVGNQRIILGNADSLEVKMYNLLTFYKVAMPKVGWDTYKTINIKYTNQIVCERTKPDSILVYGRMEPVPVPTSSAGDLNKVKDTVEQDVIVKDLEN